MNSYLDAYVGDLVALLEELELTKSTIVFFVRPCTTMLDSLPARWRLEGYALVLTGPLAQLYEQYSCVPSVSLYLSTLISTGVPSSGYDFSKSIGTKKLKVPGYALPTLLY